MSNSALRWRVFQLAWPVILENLLQTSLGIVDTIMVGRLGANALAGVGTSQQFLFFLIAVLSAVSIGSSIMAAQAIGAKDLSTARRIAKQSLIWALAIAAPLAILGSIFSHSLLQILGVTDAVADIGGNYLGITMLTGIVLVVPFTAGGVLRGAGDTRTPLYATMCANVVNIIVAYVLIFGAFGFPNLGASGSAWGAASGRLVSCGILLFALWHGRVGLTIRGRNGWRPERILLRRVISLGAPAAIEQIALSAGFLVLITVVARLGTESLAAQPIIGTLLSVSFLPGFGFGIAATALVGQRVGARNPAEGERAAIIAIQGAVIWMAALGLLFALFRTPLVSIFTAQPGVVALAAECLIPLGLMQPIWGIGIVTSGALRGAGNTRFPLIMTTCMIWGTVVLAIITTTVFNAGLLVVWCGFLVTAPITAYLVWRRFRRGDWKTLPVGIEPVRGHADAVLEPR